MYLLKVSNRNTRKRCEVCSKLIIKTPERRHRHRSGIFIVTFEPISHLFSAFTFEFEQEKIYCIPETSHFIDLNPKFVFKALTFVKLMFLFSTTILIIYQKIKALTLIWSNLHL